MKGDVFAFLSYSNGSVQRKSVGVLKLRLDILQVLFTARNDESNHPFLLFRIILQCLKEEIRKVRVLVLGNPNCIQTQTPFNILNFLKEKVNKRKLLTIFIDNTNQASNQSINLSVPCHFKYTQSTNQLISPVSFQVYPINQSTYQSRVISSMPNQSINQLISPVSFQVYPINQSTYQSRGISSTANQSINRLISPVSFQVYPANQSINQSNDCHFKNQFSSWIIEVFRLW